jgi:carboxyl-terminal processing protease
MLPANNMGTGQEVHPTNMMTTPVGAPVVGVNNAMNATRVPPCPTILVTCSPALNMGSVAPVTVSVPPMLPPCLPSTHVMGNPTINLQGLPATSLTSPSIGNGGCAPVGATLVPNVTNVFYAYARTCETLTESPPVGMTLDDLRAIGESLAGRNVESSLRDGGVGYVRIRCFSSNVRASVFHDLRALARRGMTSLVLDLRGNGGGQVEPMVQLAGDFLEEGTLVVTMTDSDGDEVEYRARQSRDYAFPVAVLVDAGTASAAEVFAVCLQAHGRAVVVGGRTYGKSDVQRVVTLPDGTPVYATVARLTVPDGRLVQGTGVEPDLPAPHGDAATWSTLAERLPPAMRDVVRRAY